MASEKRNDAASPDEALGEAGLAAGEVAGEVSAPAAPTAAAAKGEGRRPGKPVAFRRAALFACVAAAWFALDQLTKAQFADASLGQLIAGPFAGIFQFRLVHNTGMAWGMLGDSTLFLGIFSLAVCVVVLVLFCMMARSASVPLTCGLALVLAGGLGNAVDRLLLGYVVDFIEPVFIDFPVFNVADIGVTCGVVIVLVSLFFHWKQEEA